MSTARYYGFGSLDALLTAAKGAFIERGGMDAMEMEDWARCFDFAAEGRVAAEANNVALGDEGFYSLESPISLMPVQDRFDGDVIVNQAKVLDGGSMSAQVAGDASLLPAMADKAFKTAAAWPWVGGLFGASVDELKALMADKPEVLVACVDLVEACGEAGGDKLRLWAEFDLSRGECYGNTWPERAANAAMQESRIPYTPYIGTPIYLEGAEAKYGFTDVCNADPDLLKDSGLFDEFFDYVGWADAHDLLDGLAREPENEGRDKPSLSEQSRAAYAACERDEGDDTESPSRGLRGQESKGISH